LLKATRVSQGTTAIVATQAVAVNSSGDVVSADADARTVGCPTTHASGASFDATARGVRHLAPYFDTTFDEYDVNCSGD
jgi:hypothetical protein